jgi:hypothetical protein
MHLRTPHARRRTDQKPATIKGIPEDIPLGFLAKLNRHCQRWLEKNNIRTDGQLMRENYLAGVGRRDAKRNNDQEDDAIV